MATAPHDIEEFDAELPQLVATPVGDKRESTHGGRVLRILTGFFFGQGMSQGISMLAGLLLVRRLSVEAYAQFGLAVGFQTVFSVLMDLGFATTIVPLVGDRRDDRSLVGKYVRAARHLRSRTYVILAPIAAVSFLTLTRKQHWGLPVQLLLLASVLLSLYSSGKVSYFSAPLFVFGRLREYYVPQLISGTGRLVTYAALAALGGLNAWTAALLSALNITLNGALIHRASRKYFDWPVKDDPHVDKELVDYILPATPAIVFSAFQSQISLFLISFFGGTVNIAEVSALSRIGQIFAVLSTFNVVVIEPYISRQPRQVLLRKFVLLALLASALCVPIVVVAFTWPTVFIWIIGQKYDGVRDIMGWFILSCCMNLVSTLLWVMNRARKWVFWSGSILEVSLVIATQVAFLMLVGIRTTREAVMLGLASSVCYVVAHGYVSVVGFVRGVRSNPEAATAIQST
jgi:O-antigen/teichoic acid export membrane protein